jgi:hypothetical protein
MLNDMRFIKTLMQLCLLLALASCNFPIVLHAGCGDSKALIEAIDIANGTPTTLDSIELAPNCVYELEQVHNNTHGNNGLPPITSPIMIIGHGSAIVRSDKSVEEFRIFIVLSAGALSLNDLSLSNGAAYDPNPIMANLSGGAVLNMGELNLSNSTIKHNSAHGEGGGIMNIGTMTIDKSSIMYNECYIDGEWAMGGGAGVTNLGDAVISMSSISENGKTIGWDGIFNSNQGIMQIENSTISGNGNGTTGGNGIDNEGITGLYFVTLAYNFIGIGSYSGNVSMQNTLFGLNQYADCLGPKIHSVGANMDTDGTCGASLTVPPDAVFLASLGNYGGLTATNALLPNSPAIDAATEAPGVTAVSKKCPPTDQRGEPRPFGAACDLGAFEYQGITSASNALADTPTITITPTYTFTPMLRFTLTPTFTFTPEPKACTLTALVNLFCRPAPGYEPIDEFRAGQSAAVVAQSDFLWQVLGLNSGLLCTVPKDAAFVRTDGDCNNVPYFTPLPRPTPTLEPVLGCTVRQAGGAIICVSPCPAGASPGKACTP